MNTANNLIVPVYPNAGGCWFCFKDTGILVYDSEWDTEVHLECVRKALFKDPNHAEAQFMRYLLDERGIEYRKEQ